MMSSQLVWSWVILTLASMVMPTLSLECAFCRYHLARGHGAYEYQCVNDTGNYNQTKYIDCSNGCKIHMEYGRDRKTIISLERDCGSGSFFGDYCDPPGKIRQFCTFTCFKKRCNNYTLSDREEETTTSTTTITRNSGTQGSSNDSVLPHPVGVNLFVILQLFMYTCSFKSSFL